MIDGRVKIGRGRGKKVGSFLILAIFNFFVLSNGYAFAKLHAVLCVNSLRYYLPI